MLGLAGQAGYGAQHSPDYGAANAQAVDGGGGFHSYGYGGGVAFNQGQGFFPLLGGEALAVVQSGQPGFLSGQGGGQDDGGGHYRAGQGAAAGLVHPGDGGQALAV